MIGAPPVVAAVDAGAPEEEAAASAFVLAPDVAEAESVPVAVPEAEPMSVAVPLALPVAIALELPTR